MKNQTLIIEEPENIFFTADLHFGHNSILKLCNRPFQTIEEMDNKLIENWNSVIPAVGTVFIMGDMFHNEDNLPYYLQIMRKLNGQKYLIAGNHDYFSKKQYLDMGFIQVENYAEAWFGKHFIVMFHYPIAEWKRYFKGSWHLFGHAHGNFKVQENLKMLDVGVDSHNYLPWSWQEIQDYFLGK